MYKYLIMVVCYFFSLPCVAENMKFKGTYKCSQGVTDLDLTLDTSTKPVSGVFAFKTKTGISGSFTLAGSYNEETSAVVLEFKKWIDRPNGYSGVGLSGVFNANKTEITGKILSSGCYDFYVKKADSLIVGSHEKSMSQDNSQKELQVSGAYEPEGEINNLFIKNSEQMHLLTAVTLDKYSDYQVPLKDKNNLSIFDRKVKGTILLAPEKTGNVIKDEMAANNFDINYLTAKEKIILNAKNRFNNDYLASLRVYYYLEKFDVKSSVATFLPCEKSGREFTCHEGGKRYAKKLSGGLVDDVISNSINVENINKSSKSFNDNVELYAAYNVERKYIKLTPDLATKISTDAALQEPVLINFDSGGAVGHFKTLNNVVMLVAGINLRPVGMTPAAKDYYEIGMHRVDDKKSFYGFRSVPSLTLFSVDVCIYNVSNNEKFMCENSK